VIIFIDSTGNWRAPWPNCRAPSGHHQTCTKEKAMTE
jgi:hypothetical protein